MRKSIHEVIYPIRTGWSIESFAWAKELARTLHASFHVLKEKSVDSTEAFDRLLLRADGYYIIHYQQAPLKTNVIQLSGDFFHQLDQYLAHYSGQALVVIDAENANNLSKQQTDLNRHVIITLPDSVKIDRGESEFISILNQAHVLNWPKDLIQSLQQSWFKRLMQRLLSLL